MTDRELAIRADCVLRFGYAGADTFAFINAHTTVSLLGQTKCVYRFYSDTEGVPAEVCDTLVDDILVARLEEQCRDVPRWVRELLRTRTAEQVVRSRPIHPPYIRNSI